MKVKRSDPEHKGAVDKLKKKKKKTLLDAHNLSSKSALETGVTSNQIFNVKKNLHEDDKIIHDKDIVLNQTSKPNIDTEAKTIKQRHKKQKKKNDRTEDLHSEDNVTHSEGAKLKIIAKNPSTSVKDNYNQRQNKKIIFKDDTDEPEEATPSNQSKVFKKPNKKSHLQEEPKDEEIDQFCDDIDEEDNVQYVNWVKLIEAKLSKKSESSKSKTK